MKKILIFVVLLLSTFTFTGCQDIVSDTIALLDKTYAVLLEEIDLSPITTSFNLPSEHNGVTIHYESQNVGIIRPIDGVFVITKPEIDTFVPFKTTLTYKGVSKVYYLHGLVVGVNREAQTGNVDTAWNEIIGNLYRNVGQNGEVTQNLVLVTQISALVHSSVLWDTNRPGVIHGNGAVQLPITKAVNCTLTARLTIPRALMGTNVDYREERKFNFTVPQFSYDASKIKNYTTSDVSNVQLLQDKMTESGFAIQVPSQSATGQTVSITALVFQVQFSDDHFTSVELDKIQKGFNGSSLDTGWESLKTFYQKSSYGKVNIDSLILDPITIPMTAKAFEESSKFGSNNYTELHALQYVLDAKQNDINWAQHDVNQDGYLDAIYIVYSCDQEEAFSADYPPYWTYHDVFDPNRIKNDLHYGTGSSQADGAYRPLGFVWYGVQNLSDNIKALEIDVNAEILIHESGRFFGLPYFYDYARGKAVDNGLGYVDMMIANVGDHGPWSKLILGWIKPQIITDSIIVKIKSASNSGEVLLVNPIYDNSYYGQYLIIDFYTPDGLFELQTKHYIKYPVFTIPGVRIYEINFNPNRSFDPGLNRFGPGKIIAYLPGDEQNIVSNVKLTDGALFNTGSSYDWSRFVWTNENVPSNKKHVAIRVLEVNIEQDYALISITFSK
jgi:M6 family metalloprotease-like protein